MTRAVLKKGIISPLEPLPTDWQEGTELKVEKLPSVAPIGNSVPSTDQWMDGVEVLANQTTLEEDENLAAAITCIRQQAKFLAQQGKR